MCTLCPQLESFLKEAGFEYDTFYIDTAAGLTEARCRGMHTLSAPVLSIDDAVFLQPSVMFKNDVLDKAGVKLVLKEFSTAPKAQ
jgi:glutaredoxin